MSGAGHVFHLDNSYVAFGPLDNRTLTVSFSDGGQLQVYSGDGYCHGVYRGTRSGHRHRTTYDVWQRVTITWSATSGQLTLFASGTANNSTVSGGVADVHYFSSG